MSALLYKRSHFLASSGNVSEHFLLYSCYMLKTNKQKRDWCIIFLFYSQKVKILLLCLRVRLGKKATADHSEFT